MPTSVFYRSFERHEHGEGIMAHSTTYCAGCGHGLVHKYLAEAIDELGVQDRTVLISPVGCAVFMYYYFDVGNTQAAHGRAPAVAIGHKTSNPDSIVISYQGDGDLASIGLAEIISTAQLGIPITVVFVNNAIYGMTGGQMAPTTLLGQRTTTTPDGRPASAGRPLKMAELIAGLDGPVYVERVALYDNKRRTRARRAIRNALEAQVQGTGFAFVEVLSECPLHLGLDPDAAEDWVRDQMEPVFPLGVKKDVRSDADVPAYPPIPSPTFEPESLLDAVTRDRRSARRVSPRDSRPTSIGRTSASSSPAPGATERRRPPCSSHGARSTRGSTRRTSRATGPSPAEAPRTRTSTSRSARCSHPRHRSRTCSWRSTPRAWRSSDPSFGPAGPSSTTARSSQNCRPASHRACKRSGFPSPSAARDLGNVLVKNVVALGALQAATGLFPEETFLTAIREALRAKEAMIPLNEAAFGRGVELVRASPGYEAPQAARALTHAG